MPSAQNCPINIPFAKKIALKITNCSSLELFQPPRSFAPTRGEFNQAPFEFVQNYLPSQQKEIHVSGLGTSKIAGEWDLPAVY